MRVAEIWPRSAVTPTPVQTWLVAQDTPLKTFWPAPGMSGVDRRLHLAPFHTSASVREGPNEGVFWPTAVHDFAETHETRLSELPEVETGFGVGWAVQAVPFHTSASVTCWKLALE
jgi:hypothetical protein